MERRAFEDWWAAQEKPSTPKKDRHLTYGFLMNEKKRVRAFITKLDVLERVVVYLRYWENLMISEIAQAVGLSDRKVDELLESAVKTLRSLYITELSQLQSTKAAMAGVK